MQDNKPTTHQGDLAKLPRALAPLVERPQWAVWRWTQQPNGRWQKPPYQALDPQRHASTKDPDTWSDYATALAAVQAGKADGISYVLTEADPFAAIDLDHCRHPDTALDRRLGAEFPRCGSSHLCRSDAVRRRLPDLGFDGRRYRSGQQKIHAGDRRQADCRRAVPAHPESADHYRLSARHHPGAHQSRSGV